MRSMATLSAFMAGFSNVAFVQFDFEAIEIPYAILMGFSVTNALTVGFPVDRLCQSMYHRTDWIDASRGKVN